MKQKDNDHIRKKKGLEKKNLYSESHIYIIQRTNIGFQNVSVYLFKKLAITRETFF